jgi:hypothetical protein
MNRGIVETLALIGLGLATFVVTPVHAQTTAPGPYYATPSWDQQLPAATRFIVLSNWNSEAVLDRETGLVWQRSPLLLGAQTLRNASQFCLFPKGNRAGWRLPTVNELASLFDPANNPPLPSGHPFLGLPADRAIFWSATASFGEDGWQRAVGYTTFTSGVQFVTPSVFVSPENTAFVWCVRGGLQVGPQ